MTETISGRMLPWVVPAIYANSPGPADLPPSCDYYDAICMRVLSAPRWIICALPRKVSSGWIASRPLEELLVECTEGLPKARRTVSWSRWTAAGPYPKGRASALKGNPIQHAFFAHPCASARTIATIAAPNKCLGADGQIPGRGQSD